jgi:hypothetical protein
VYSRWPARSSSTSAWSPGITSFDSSRRMRVRTVPPRRRVTRRRRSTTCAEHPAGVR